MLNNHWQTISTDLEMLQTEGFAASKQVDPFMVVKKVKGIETEVQDGWVGHILPFELVQATFLNKELQALKQQESRLAEINSELEAVLDSFTEEEKSFDTINESGDGFEKSAVAKAAKEFKAEIKKKRKFDSESYEAKILKVDELVTEDKELRKTVKEAAEALHIKTKTTIENLSNQQVNHLLELKWITPLLSELSQLPTDLIHQLTRQVQTLADKYATTYSDVANEIKKTEKTLAGLIDELTGNEFDQQGLAELKAFLQG